MQYIATFANNHSNLQMTFLLLIENCRLLFVLRHKRWEFNFCHCLHHHVLFLVFWPGSQDDNFFLLLELWDINLFMHANRQTERKQHQMSAYAVSFSLIAPFSLMGMFSIVCDCIDIELVSMNSWRYPASQSSVVHVCFY